MIVRSIDRGSGCTKDRLVMGMVNSDYTTMDKSRRGNMEKHRWGFIFFGNSV